MTVLAFHGDGSTAANLIRDSKGYDLIDWSIEWTQHKNHIPDLIDWIDSVSRRSYFLVPPPFILLGHSRGGDFICRLLEYEYFRINTIGLILYECPKFHFFSEEALNKVKRLSVLGIWNDYEPVFSWRQKEKHSTREFWRYNTYYTELLGRLTSHIKFSWRRPFLSAAWDTELNPLILQWIKQVERRTKNVPANDSGFKCPPGSLGG